MWSWQGSAGYRTPAHDEPLASDALFPVYSITKTFVAVLTLRLVEIERLRLDQCVAEWLPDLPHATEITIRHLLNQTSGIPDYGDQRLYHEAVRAHPGKPWDLDAILACALEKSWMFDPGTSWAYANPNYWIIGHIIEHVTGQSLHTALTGHLFAPLGLTQTVYPEAEVVPFTPGWSQYLDTDAPEIDISTDYHPGWAGPAGALLSTAAEVAQFYDTVLAGNFLQPDSQTALLELTLVPGEHPEWYQPYYGLGLMCQKGTSLGTMYGHGGSGPGYQTLAQYIPDHNLTAVVLSNSDRISPDALLYPFVKRLLKKDLV